MKHFIALFTVLFLCACEYDAPFVETAELPVDKALTGMWEEIPTSGEASDPNSNLVIIPFNANEYIVVDSPAKDGLYFRAYPVRIGQDLFVQRDWLGAEEKRYHLCRYAVSDEVLSVQLVNDKIISPEIKDSNALQEALLTNLSDPALFEEIARYRKLNK